MLETTFQKWRAFYLLVFAVFFITGVQATLAAGFRITSIRATNNDIQLNWNAPGGSNYVVQSVTPLGSNFVDLGVSNFIPKGVTQALTYTHVGARTSAASRFYRVRAFAPARLEIQPTNAMIAPGMTNRFKVFLVDSDNVTNDITASASLSVTSLTPTVAQFVRITTNGFAAVRGVSVGIAPIRAVYQGVSNTVSLMVSNMTGGMFSVPSSFSGYVEGQPSTGKVFGIFGNKIVNITPATDVGAAAEGVTRVDSYNVASDVANSFALVTGQSAANNSIVFIAGPFQTDEIPVTWCKFASVILEPRFTVIHVGETQAFSVFGYRVNGTSVNVSDVEINAFSSSDDNIGRANSSSRTVVGIAPGDVTITVDVNNGAGCSISTSFALLSVAQAPAITQQPADQIVILGGDAALNVAASGTAPLAYQWQFRETNVGGATSKSLIISNAIGAQQGDYRVIVTNAYGSVTSTVATLTVAEPGMALWTNVYNGPVNSNDAVFAIAADGNGNVFVTGHSVGSSSGQDYATVKYSGAGVPLWTNRYNGLANGNDRAGAVAVDSVGNVFVSGSSVGNTALFDYATIKYSGAGMPLWTNRYRGPGDFFDFAKGLAVDSNGNAFVTGSSYAANGYNGFATIKYSAAGLSLWTNRYDGSSPSSNEPRAIAVDSSGNVFVTGTSYSSDHDFVTLKYSTAGVPLWTNRYNGPGIYFDIVTAIAVDSNGDVLVTGSSFDNFRRYDFVTIKYSGAGLALWTNRYNGTGNTDDYPRSIAVDSNGNVFVTGYSGPDGAFDVDFVTLKYSAAGMPLWTNRFSGPAHGYDAPSAITVDSGGNVFVAGYSYFFDGSSGGYTYDMMTIKYSNTGTLLWLGRYPHAVATAAIVTHDGNLTVTGYSSVHDNPSDYVTLKYCSGFAASNDNFSSRIILNGTSVNTNGNNNCASREAGEPNHAGNIGGKSHWWSWAAPASGPVTITTCGSAFDTLLAVYTGTSISGLTLVTNNNDNVICGAGSVQSQVQFNAVSATTYQIAVDGYKDPNEPTPRSGNIVLTIQQ